MDDYNRGMKSCLNVLGYSVDKKRQDFMSISLRANSSSLRQPRYLIGFYYVTT